MSEGITEIVQNEVANDEWTLSFLKLIRQYLEAHGYPDPVGVLIVPLMRDGFGVLAAADGAGPLSQEKAFEYLIACGDALRDFIDR
jgi:hypothetical protein